MSSTNAEVTKVLDLDQKVAKKRGQYIRLSSTEKAEIGKSLECGTTSTIRHHAKKHSNEDHKICWTSLIHEKCKS